MEELRKRIAALPEGNHVIAIDGRCAAGKTTLAQKLAEELGAGVVHMDDFFLPVELRNEERYAQPGGNVHYERFAEEILPRIHSGEAFSYRKFDCKSMMLGELQAVRSSRFVIVEGAYSCHPALGHYMSLRVFMDVYAVEQQKRIRIRNGEDRLQDFLDRWIPMEEAYFKEYGIYELADVVLK